MVSQFSRIVLFSLVLVLSAACNKGGNESEEGGNESEEGGESGESSANAEPQWIVVGELPVEARVLPGTTVTPIASSLSVRMPNDCEFRVWAPPSNEMMAGMRTHERAMGDAQRGLMGALEEVLVDEPGDSSWMLGFRHADSMRPGETKWTLKSLRDVGGVGYECTSNTTNLEAFECAIEACRSLRSPQ